MDMEIISGGLKEKAPINAISDQDMVGPTISPYIGKMSPSGLSGGDIASPIAGLFAGALGGVPRFASSAVSVGRGLQNLLGGKELETPFIGEYIDPYLNKASDVALSGIQGLANLLTPEKIQSAMGQVTGGYLTPQSELAKKATQITQDIGSLIGTGASPSTAALSVGGRESARAVGLGPVWQAAAGILAPGIASAWNATKPTKLRDFSIRTYKKEYPQAAKIAQRLKFDATEMKKDLTNLISTNKRQLEGITDKEQVFDNLKKIINATTKTGKNTVKANVKKIWDYKKDLNKLVHKSIINQDKGTEEIYKRAVGSLNNFLDKASQAHPSFGKSFKLAEDLYKLSNLKGGILDAMKRSKDIKSLLNSLPFLKTALLGGIYKYAGLKTAGLTALGSRAFNIFNLAKNNPNLQSHLLQIADNATLGKFKELKGLLPILDKELKNAVEDKMFSSAEIISGGLKE